MLRMTGVLSELPWSLRFTGNFPPIRKYNNRVQSHDTYERVANSGQMHGLHICL